jgi:hypothetical protein
MDKFIKEKVDGIILILSCQKHQYTRLKEFKLNNIYYNNWKVIYVIGDFFLNNNYEIRDTNYMWIKCEDSYIHLLKKLILSIKYLYEIFDIKEGILRCGDDLIFDENRLLDFIKNKKYDYYGKAYGGKNYICNDINVLKNTIKDKFMLNYYNKHKEDFDNPQHNLKGIDISKYLIRPSMYFPAGVIFYLSNKSCNILINHMESIKYNIFHFDEFTKSYPYIIEDCGVAYILYKNNIPFTNNPDFFDTKYSICKHTNKYKDNIINKTYIINKETIKTDVINKETIKTDVINKETIKTRSKLILLKKLKK